MRAVVLYGPNDLRYEEVPTPTARAGEIVLRTRAAAICGTDLRIIDGSKTRGVRIPGIVGHEIAGDVWEVGSGVSGFRAGERISVTPIVSCGVCYYCTRGMENVCADMSALGYELAGGFAEYVAVPAAAVAGGNVYRLPDAVSYEEGALAEPLACCINGVEKAMVGLGQTVLVVGAGPIGLMHVQLARAAGAGEVIVSEPRPHRRRLAGELGATVLVDPAAEDLAAVVAAKTDGLGVDAVIMAIGVADSVGDLLRLVRKGGFCNLFAGFPGGGETTISANVIHYNEVNVVGTSSSARRHYAKALRLIATGAVNVRALVTGRFPLHAAAEAVAAVRRGDGLRVVICPGD